MIWLYVFVLVMAATPPYQLPAWQHITICSVMGILLGLEIGEKIGKGAYRW